MKPYLRAFAMTGVLYGCASTSPPTARVYTPRFQTIAFDFMERYRVSHDYFIGPGIKQCGYVRRWSQESSATQLENFAIPLDRAWRTQEPRATLEFERIFHVDNGLPVHEGVKDGEATACLPVLDTLMDRQGSRSYAFDINRHRLLQAESQVERCGTRPKLPPKGAWS